jgi:hypothetical protein
MFDFPTGEHQIGNRNLSRHERLPAPMITVESGERVRGAVAEIQADNVSSNFLAVRSIAEVLILRVPLGPPRRRARRCAGRALWPARLMLQWGSELRALKLPDRNLTASSRSLSCRHRAPLRH